MDEYRVIVRYDNSLIDILLIFALSDNSAKARASRILCADPPTKPVKILPISNLIMGNFQILAAVLAIKDFPVPGIPINIKPLRA